MRSINRKMSEWLDIPLDAFGDLPRMELVGEHQLRLENHRGIERFTPHLLRFRTKIGKLELEGEQLHIESISTEAIYIQGKIRSFRYIDE